MSVKAGLENGVEGRSLAWWVNSGARASCYSGQYGTSATTPLTFKS